MLPQIAFSKIYKFTLVALVSVFSDVYFQMCLQNSCLRKFIVTLVAFVCLFTTVRLGMHPQLSCLRGCRFTLIAFIRFFPLFVFKCLLKWLAWADASSHWLHFFTCLHCGNSYVSSDWMYHGMHSHTGSICLVFLNCGFSNVSTKRLHKRM